MIEVPCNSLELQGFAIFSIQVVHSNKRFELTSYALKMKSKKPKEVKG